MVFHRVVQVGRVVFISEGKDEGKLATIVNVIDGNRVLIDGPTSGVVRGVRNLKELQLTKFTAAVEEAKVDEQFKKSAWAKKIQQKALKSRMTDFDRYKLMRAKQMRNRIIRVELAKLKKAQK
ncbi:unnamed protein product [Caenorhabditis auriculariae]|uniref:Large ribosomal subunit protein eL14 n=1 Tax=Caenorhabditis auriculariae TaxID=2777116 RepID=A0A8S1GZ71_9PELO|nr:unnamed protein product [Caenorhabditis auriculariae]